MEIRYRDDQGEHSVALEKYGKTKVSFGRMKSKDIYIEHVAVSREHGYFAFENGKWLLFDPGSSYGTTVNGKRITGSKQGTPLHSGDRIVLAPAAKNPMTVHVLSEAQIVPGGALYEKKESVHGEGDTLIIDDSAYEQVGERREEERNGKESSKSDNGDVFPDISDSDILLGKVGRNDQNPGDNNIQKIIIVIGCTVAGILFCLIGFMFAKRIMGNGKQSDDHASESQMQSSEESTEMDTEVLGTSTEQQTESTTEEVTEYEITTEGRPQEDVLLASVSATGSWQNQYKELLGLYRGQQTAGANRGVFGFFYDFNKDEIPELILRVFDTDDTYCTASYTYANGKLKRMTASPLMYGGDHYGENTHGLPILITVSGMDLNKGPETRIEFFRMEQDDLKSIKCYMIINCQTKDGEGQTEPKVYTTSNGGTIETDLTSMKSELKGWGISVADKFNSDHSDNYYTFSFDFGMSGLQDAVYNDYESMISYLDSF